SITVGSPAFGAAELDVGSPSSGSILTTGSGTFTVNHTGTVNVGAPFSLSGTLNANGDIAVSGGLLAVNGAFNWAPGKTMTISGGGSVILTGGYATAAGGVYNINGVGSTLQVNANPLMIAGGATVNATACGSVSSSANLDVGITSAGTLLVD